MSRPPRSRASAARGARASQFRRAHALAFERATLRRRRRRTESLHNVCVFCPSEMWRLRRDFAPCSRAPSPQVTDMTNGASEHRSSIRSVVFSSASLLSPLSARINDDVRKCSSTHGPGSNPGRVFIVRVRVRGRAPPLLTRFSLSSISTVFHLTVAMFCVFFTRTGRPGRELDDGRARRGVGSSRARARALASPRLASPRLASLARSLAHARSLDRSPTDGRTDGLASARDCL